MPQAYLLTPSDTPLAVATPPASAEISEPTRKAVRTLLRWGGHKPSGRGRPASESLLKSLLAQRWPQIHPLVDMANLLSLQSGLPLSVLDAGQLVGDLELRVGREGEEYIFNPSGQVLKLSGLLLVADQHGPVGSPVKDCQRTKVASETARFLVLVWGTSELPQATESVEQRLEPWCQRHQVQFQSLPID